MIFNRLGNTDIQLSAIGLGTWAIGGGNYEFGWGEQDDNDSIETIHRALDLGINWIDTAPIYGLGRSEEVVGKAIKGVRNKIFISSKCGFQWDKNRKIFSTLKSSNIRAEVEASLKRLKIDYIDLYQIHKPNPENEIEEAWKTLNDLKKEGKIRYAGVSSFSLNQLKQIHSIEKISFIQPEYNMLVPTIQDNGILDFCEVEKIGVIVYSPMAMGFLTGKYTKEMVEKLPPDDSRLAEVYFQQPFLNVNLQLIEHLKGIANKYNMLMAHLAIAWILRKSEITAAIVGARKPNQIEETVLACEFVLSKEDYIELNKILNYHYTKIKNIQINLV